MKNFLNINKKFKNNKGSITLFTLLSMLFFLIVVIAIYASVNTKVQKQQKELNTIQKSYEQQEQINDIYEKKYDDYINSETSTIQVYADTNLKGEVKGQKKNTLGTVYTDVAQNKIKIFGGANSTYAYSETADGKRIVLSGNEMTIQATTSGKTIYTWVKGEDGEYTKYYTAVTVKLSTLQDKTIYVAEGKSTDIEINGENKGKITYSQIDTSYISIENNKVTGIKAGDTTITATESNGGAQAKITIKIVKLTLEKTKGITTVGDNKKIQVSGINNGTISAKSNDETIAKVTVSGTEVTIIPQKVGNIKITITESNAGASTEYEIQVVSITLAQNGGKYTMPTTGKATIKTKVKVENASKIEVAWTSSTLEWKTIENNSEIIKNDCEKGTYYLYVKVDDEYLYQSQAFIVGEEKIAIAIKTSTTEWTNKDITATITYPDVTTNSTRKAGYGTTLANAQTASNSATAPTTSVTVSANGYVFATATDSAGNVVTSSKQITNIDKTLPTVTLSPNGGSYAKPTSGNATIKTKITASDTGGSGLKTLEYAWSTSNTTEPTTYTTFTNGATVSKTDCTTGKYYLWTRVYDNAGNRATTGKVSAGFVVGAKTIIITPNTTAWTNQNVTATIAYPDVTTSSTRKAGYGTTLANAQTASTSATAPTTSVTVSANGYVFATATDSAGNVITASRQITNIDKIAPIISEIKNSSNENWTNKTISLSWTITENGGSGISEVRFGRDGINWIDKLAQNEWYGFTRNYERNDAIYLQVIDKAGNKSNIVSTKMKTDLTEPQVTISPNGGSYAAPSAGSMATIKTTLTASDTGGSGLKTLEYAWSTSNTTEPTTYTTFTNGATVSKTDCTTGTYYLWTRVYDNAGNRATKGKVSSEFFVGTMAITITPSTTAWTNQNVIATVKYPDATVSNTRKAGFGTTLESAKTAANSSTAPATSVTASQNGYIYATATDVSGNVLTMTRQISNIDKTGPVISEITNSSNQNWTNQAIKLSWTITENGSGISKVRFGYDGVNWQDYLNETEWYGMTRNNERNDRIYIMAIDKTGNTSNIVSTALKIDKSAPTMATLTISPTGYTTEDVTITGKATDTRSGIVAYQWSTNSGLTASSGGWTSITATNSQITQTYTASANGTYYFYTKDSAGNVGKTSINISNICTWEEIAQIAKVISNTSTITDDSETATVTVNGIQKTLKVGEVKYLDGKKVRILGFNHDTLSSSTAYGSTTATGKAGISFEYVDFLMEAPQMNSSATNSGGWAQTELRGTLNSTTYNSLSIKNSIKKVKKDYIPTYDVAKTQQTDDYLWLLSCGEIWDNGYNGGVTRGDAITTEGKQYKYYKMNLGSISYSTSNNITKKPSASDFYVNVWWLRSPYCYNVCHFCYVSSSGICSATLPGPYPGVAPGFSI